MIAGRIPRRPNHRGRLLAFPLGVAVAALAALLNCLWIAAGAELGRWPLYILGVALLGLVDDALGGAGPRGLRGHGTAALAGEISTGAVKAAGTAGLALYAAAGAGRAGAALAATAGVLLLAPHAGNLLDTAPGRVEKAVSVSLVGICTAGRTAQPLALLAPSLVPLLAGWWLTLRERAMLGDSGASMAGAVAGAAVVMGGGLPLTIFALSGLLAISVFGEFRSLGAAIGRIPLLAHLDSLGRSS